MDKDAILTDALAARNAEVLSYQINIDNYTRAIAKIDEMKDPGDDMLEFRKQLGALLASEQREQAKAALMRDVIAEQVSGA